MQRPGDWNVPSFCRGYSLAWRVYYTKCAILKVGCETLKIHVCNIKICMVPFRAFSTTSLVKEKRIEEVFMTKKVIRILG